MYLGDAAHVSCTGPNRSIANKRAASSRCLQDAKATQRYALYGNTVSPIEQCCDKKTSLLLGKSYLSSSRDESRVWGRGRLPARTPTLHTLFLMEGDDGIRWRRVYFCERAQEREKVIVKVSVESALFFYFPREQQGFFNGNYLSPHSSFSTTSSIFIHHFITHPPKKVA